MTQQLLKLGYLMPKNTVFFVCDIQERFRPTMKIFDNFVKNAKKLVSIFHVAVFEMNIY